MRAMVQDRYGTAEVLELRTIDRPPISSTQALIEVQTAGVDRGVAHLVSGIPYLIRVAGYGLTKPKHPVPGADVAGRVVAVGDDVTRFRPGDEVFGIANGAYAPTTSTRCPASRRPTSVSVCSASGGEAGQRVLVVGA